jgi:hypothetical protein
VEYQAADVGEWWISTPTHGNEESTLWRLVPAAVLRRLGVRARVATAGWWLPSGVGLWGRAYRLSGLASWAFIVWAECETWREGGISFRSFFRSIQLLELESETEPGTQIDRICESNRKPET